MEIMEILWPYSNRISMDVTSCEYDPWSQNVLDIMYVYFQCVYMYCMPQMLKFELSDPSHWSF